MPDNLTTQTTVATVPSGSRIATDAVTYSGDADAHIAPVSLVTISGSEGSKTASAVSTSNPLPISDAGGSLTVDGTVAVSGTVTVGSHAVTNAGTFAVQESGSALTALQLIDNLVLAEDAVHASADPGVQALAVRKATPANLSGADGDYEPLQVSAGRLWTSATIDAALPAGSANIGDVDVLTVPAPLSTTGGGTEATALRVTLASDSTGVVSVDDNGSTISIDDGGGAITVDGTVAVSGTVTVDSELTTADLDTGAGTDTRAVVGLVGAASGGGALIPGSATDGLLVNLGTNNDVTVTGSVTATLVAGGDVDVLTVPAPLSTTGGGTEATALRVTLASDSTGVVSVDDNGGSLTVDGTVTANLAAGTNNIGDVDVLSVVPGTGATNLGKAEDAAHTTGDTGVMALGVRLDTGASLAGTDGDYAPFQLDSSGNLRVNVAAGGAGDGAILDGVTSSIKATVFDYTNSNPLAVRLTDTGGDYVGAGAGTQYTEDAAAAADPVGTMVMAVRADSLAAVTSADGDNIAVRATNNGELYVKQTDAVPVTDNGGALTVDGTVAATQSGTWNVTNVSGTVSLPTGASTLAEQQTQTTALQLIDDAIVADDAAFTPATTKVMMAGFEFDDTTPDSVNEGDAGAARMSANRNIYTTIRDAAGNERGVNVNASNQLAVSVDNTVTVASHAVTNAGTFAVQVDAALPAGTNNIGDVDILSIAAGDNNIGNVDVVTLPNVTLAAGTNTNEIVGDVAHDVAVAGNPVRIAGRAINAEYTAVATGDTADIVTTLTGKAITQPYATPALTWSYAAASGGITNTTGVTAKAAAGAGVRNYITRCQVINGHATVSTDVQIRDGASGTVLWRGFAQAAGGGVACDFDPPLRGTANTLVEVACGTTGSATYFNLQGYTSAD